MSNYKRKLANFAFFDQKEIEKTLEQMAAQGWMVCKTGNLFWTYEKIPPQKLRFAVTYFPGASNLDPTPSEKLLDKEDLCAQEGWRLVLRWEAMQIFCTDREDAVPIETDPVPQVANIHKTMKKNMLTGQLVSIAMVLWCLFLQIWDLWRDPVYFLSRWSRLLLLIMWLVLLAGDIFPIWNYFRWQRKAQKAAEQGIFLPLHTNKGLGWSLAGVCMVFLFLSIASSETHLWLMLSLFVMMGLGFLVARWMTQMLKKKGVPCRVNLVLCSFCIAILTLVGVSGIIAAGVSGGLPINKDPGPTGSYEWQGRVFDIYSDPLPLNVEDLVDVEAEWSKKAYFQESPILAHGNYRQDILHTQPIKDLELHYEITDVKIPGLYHFVKESLLNARQDEVHEDFVFVDHFEPIDPTLWNAEEAYQLHWSDSVLDTYLVCWERRIVQITFFWEPTDSQIAAAATILCP